MMTRKLQFALTHSQVTMLGVAWWSNGKDAGSKGRDSRSGRYEVTTGMGECLGTGKPFRYITNTKVNSAFHLSVVGKSTTGLLG